MHLRTLFSGLGLALGMLAMPLSAAPSTSAPELTHQKAEDWINSPPLKLADLHGKVVMIDFWTFGCWNCYRSFPWMNGLRERYAAQGLQIISVHTPESESERKREDIAQKTRQFELTNPVMIDDDSSYWKAMGNRYWPTFYLIDKKGKVRAQFIGETHDGDRNAGAVESMVKRLLAEN